MKLTPEETALAIRDLIGEALRILITVPAGHALKLNNSSQMAAAIEPIALLLESTIREIEQPYSRRTVPAPTDAKQHAARAHREIRNIVSRFCEKTFADDSTKS